MCPNSIGGRCREVFACLPGLACCGSNCVFSLCSVRRYLSPERLASVRREDPRSRTTSSSSNCSAKKEG